MRDFWDDWDIPVVIAGLLVAVFVIFAMSSERDVTPSFDTKGGRYAVVGEGPKGVQIVWDREQRHCYVVSAVTGYWTSAAVTVPAPNAWCEP